MARRSAANIESVKSLTGTPFADISHIASPARLQQAIYAVISDSKCGWDHIVPALTKLGFLLLDKPVAGSENFNGDPVANATSSSFHVHRQSSN